MSERPVALVTGAAIRVGRAIALELARHGFDLVLHYRGSKPAFLETAQACREAGASVFEVQADLASPEGCAAVVAAAQAVGRLDLLVNNASVFSRLPFEQVTDRAWDEMLAINLTAPFRLSRDLLPLLRAAPAERPGAVAGAGPLVVHLCDIGAERPVSQYAHYSVSKAGLLMLVRAMAVELAPAIRTLGISPGQVAWPEDYSAEQRASLTRRIPLQRPGTPEDIARLVRFLALEAPYMNGEVLAVDGGLQCRY